MYEQYDRAVESVHDYLNVGGFSRTPKKEFQQAIREFRKYLSASNLEYSQEVAAKWLADIKKLIPRRKFLAHRRALALVDQVLKYGYVKYTRFSYGISRYKYRAPDCFSSYLEAYLKQRREDGCTYSTLQMVRVACSRFLLFLEACGITTFSLLTPEISKAYCKQEEHRTVEGKNAYILRARGLIRFLASKHIVPETLEYAFATEKASRVTIVKTLSLEQIESIDAYRKNASSPSTLRNAAMAMLALRLGLRSIDICNLRLSDIRWSSATISITQSKTGRQLTLPFSAVVGNALSRYILEGRPHCDCPYVFITLKHPHQRLADRSGCYRTSTEILGVKQAITETRGLHIARKTYASELLKANTPVSLIAQALGHTDDTTVDTYLATDKQRMRSCEIGLAGIEPTGVLQ